MSLKVFVLEDEIDYHPRSAIVGALEGHKATFAKSFPEAKEKYEGPYDLLLLDHDMEGRFEASEHPNTGYQFVKWLVNDWGSAMYPHVVIHSHNYHGRRNMRSLLEAYGFSVEEFPFNTEYVAQLKRILSAHA